MPAAPKSPTPKKQGAPKAKGAVRAKSGCYTCRIRRKKCDERPNHNNACETCVRLRLECLGFGAKRPDWLRENTKVMDLRERIKTFLASQGMIKGHSGSGPRGSDNEPVILRLNDQEYSSSSESPRSGILTLSSATEDFRPLHHTSAIRDEQTWGTASSYPSGGLLLHPRIRDRSSLGIAHSTHSTPPPPLRHSPPYSSFNNPEMTYFEPNNASNSLVPLIPTLASSFSPLYYSNFQDYDEPTYQITSVPCDPTPDMLVEHYMKHVIGLQYLLVDQGKISPIILPSVHVEGPSRYGARLLAQIHAIRTSQPQQPALQLESVKVHYDALKLLLDQQNLDDSHAMASLHVVSSFLFDGGHGEWEEWLNFAFRYCEQTLEQYPDGIIEALMRCTEQQRFLIKTTIWFDVLAAVTTLKAPRLLNVIRALCTKSRVYDPTTPLPSELSMMPIMGCENHVVLALAETSALAEWKNNKEAKGGLSIAELVSRGSDISVYLDTNLYPPTQYSQCEDTIDVLRQSTSEIFHASTRIYLASVVNGDHVSVPEIANAVRDLIQCVKRMPAEHSDPIVRSTVFSFFICGCFTESPAYRKVIADHLGSGVGPGNCNSVKRMLEEVWDSRSAKKKSEPIQWRQMLHRKRLLLV